MGIVKQQNKRKTALYALGLFGGLISVAVWGKMRFVTDLPKMAYADPEEQRTTESTQAEEDLDTNTLQPNSESENGAPETGGN